MKKSNLPRKVCLTCGRPFTWRKKWKKCWEEVKYCGEKCRRNKNSSNHHSIHGKSTKPIV